MLALLPTITPVAFGLAVALSALALGLGMGFRFGQRFGYERALGIMERTAGAVHALKVPDTAAIAAEWLMAEGMEPERVRDLQAEGRE